jgi:hypothetical protein
MRLGLGDELTHIRRGGTKQPLATREEVLAVLAHSATDCEPSKVAVSRPRAAESEKTKFPSVSCVNTPFWIARHNIDHALPRYHRLLRIVSIPSLRPSICTGSAGSLYTIDVVNVREVCFHVRNGLKNSVVGQVACSAGVHLQLCNDRYWRHCLLYLYHHTHPRRICSRMKPRLGELTHQRRPPRADRARP